jgi:hypothetical protein
MFLDVRRGRKLAMRTLAQAVANVHARDGEGRGVLDITDLMFLRSRDEKIFALYEPYRDWLSGPVAGSAASECPAWGSR